MNITLDSQYSKATVTGSDSNINTTEYRTASPSNVWGSGYALDITDKVMDDKAYQGQGVTVEDIMQQAQGTNVHAQKDFMIVMSNSVSGEDLEKMKEEGFDPGSTDVETYVSMVDKIKVTLAKAGVQIAGYTDDIDVATIQEIAGTSINAQELMTKLQGADIPVTKFLSVLITSSAISSISIMLMHAFNGFFFMAVFIVSSQYFSSKTFLKNSSLST